MDRNKKMYLCVKSLLNISKDLKDDYEDFSSMILFIADRIAEKEQRRETEEELYTVHGDGKCHDLEGKDHTCHCEEKKVEDVFDPTSDEEKAIEKEIDEMISTVRKEMKVVSN